MLNFRLENKPSKIDGKGAFALQKIEAGKKIGNLGGEVISLREARRRVKLTKRVAMVEFGDGRALDASINANELRYVNHSCRPNSYMRVCYSRVEFYALRTIKKGEEITCSYGSTHHDGALKCRCGTPGCTGYL